MAKATREQVSKSRDKNRDIGGDRNQVEIDLTFKKPPPDDEIKWLLAYLPEAFPLPFGDVHFKIAKAVSYAIEQGGNVPIAAPRGTGKSTIVNGLLLRALLEGLTPFPVVIPWDDRAKKRALRFWANELCFNPRLARDYDDITRPFVESRGVANRLAAIHSGGKATGARLGITEGIIILPDGYGAIGSATINGNPRGLNYATIDGRIIRPSLCVIDDPQDRETAKSQIRVRDTIDRVEGDVAGMAGPDSQMPIVMTCTVISRGDVADHFLTHPDWNAIRVAQISEWPNGFDDENSTIRKLWDEWNQIRQDGETQKDKGKLERAFYRKHKKQLIDGMVVSWKYRFDKRRGQPDAMYAAMLDYYKMGHAAFMAERQNEPIEESSFNQYRLTPDVVLSRIRELHQMEVPLQTTVIGAHCDINRAGLHWCVAASDNQMTVHIPIYGRFPQRGDLWKENATTHERQSAINAGLRALCDQLAASRFTKEAQSETLGLLLIDAGFESDTVHRFCENAKSYPFKVAPAIGRASHKYRFSSATIIGQPKQECHLQRPQKRTCPYVMFNADFWREHRQRAFFSEIGVPGGCSLFKSSSKALHMTFADHLCAEILKNKYLTDAGLRWEYSTAPGSVWDWGDALSGAYVAIAMQGIGTGGQVVKQNRRIGVVMKGKTTTAGGEHGNTQQTNTEQAKPRRTAIIGRGRY